MLMDEKRDQEEREGEGEEEEENKEKAIGCSFMALSLCRLPCLWATVQSPCCAPGVWLWLWLVASL